MSDYVTRIRKVTHHPPFQLKVASTNGILSIFSGGRKKEGMKYIYRREAALLWEDARAGPRIMY
jgi:hypothetical protein